MFDWLSWENPVAIWWVLLSGASIVNICFWLWTWSYRPRNKMLASSGVYVFVCAFRSIFPRADVQRICLFDTWFSSVMIGRSAATLAELAFVAQWVLLIKSLANQTNSSFASKAANFFLPLIAIAEICSWYAVIRTHYLGNAIEESLWAITYSLIGISVFTMVPKLKSPLKLAAIFLVVGSALYVAFMMFVDVPMYISRMQQDLFENKKLLGFAEGIIDLNTRWHVTHSIVDWKSEIPWQTLYFTFAVLVSIALCYVPLKPNQTKDSTN